MTQQEETQRNDIETLKDNIKSLEAKLAKKDKINRVLMARVEKSVDSAGDAYSIFENNILLQKHIEERIGVEKDLRESEERLRTILESLQTGVMIIDAADHHIVDINPIACHLIGLPKESIVGRKCHRFVCPAEKNKCPVLDLGEKVDSSERVLLNVNKGKTPILKTAIPIILDGRKHLIETFIDITERKKAEQALLDSEIRYRDLVETSADAIVNVDEKMHVVLWNRSAECLFGYKEEEVKGHSLSLLIPEKYREKHKKGFERFLETEKANLVGQTVEVEGRCKDGAMVPIELSLSASKMKESWVFTAIIRNITDRKEAEAAAQRSHDIQSVINALLEIASKDIPFEELLNRALELIISIPWLALKGKGCIFLVGEDPDFLIMRVQNRLGDGIQKSCAKLPIGRCLCGRAALKRKTVFADKIDDRHDVIVPGMRPHGHYCVPVSFGEQLLGVINLYVREGHQYNQDEEEFLNCVANALAGIIIRKQSKKEKADMESQLRHMQKIEAIGTLAGGIAHDFNNLLYPIIGLTEITIEDLPEGSQSRSNMEEVCKAANRAKELVAHILAFSRQEEGKRNLLTVGPVLKEALKLLRGSIPSMIQLRHNIDADAQKILGEPTQIHQVIMNLCTNAAHAMREYGGVLEVSLDNIDLDAEPAKESKIRPGKYVRLRVVDSGHGINPREANKIFDPYFTTKGPGEGSGMGLSVVHGIVKSYGGHISFNSEPGKGTTFEVHFPVAKTKDAIAKNAPPQEIISGENERILVVDDEATVVRVLSQMLTRIGYRVTSLTCSEEALETFRANPEAFDLIITDQSMPKMTGVELAQKIMGVRPNIPIILSTGYSEMVSEKTARGMGIDEYMVKPIVSSQVAMMVRRALENRKEV